MTPAQVGKRPVGSCRAADGPLTLLIITDGRWEYLTKCLQSVAEHLPMDRFSRVVLAEDAAQSHCVMPPSVRDLVRSFGPRVTHTGFAERHGLAAMVQRGWDAADPGPIFHLEDDFTFTGPPYLDGMLDLLDYRPDCAQVCLQRQPVNHEEALAGGVVLANQERFEYRDAVEWHSDLFWLNPCIYPQWVRDVGWPEHGGEREFTDRLHAAHPDARFAVWGSRYDAPAVWHIGNHRSQGWKL